jgi:hypothetical protein
MHYGQPYITMSSTIANDSSTMPLIPLLVYMLLTGQEDVKGLLPPPRIDVSYSIVPDDASDDAGKGKQHFTRSVAAARRSAGSSLAPIKEHAYGLIDVKVFRPLFHVHHACSPIQLSHSSHYRKRLFLAFLIYLMLTTIFASNSSLRLTESEHHHHVIRQAR